MIQVPIIILKIISYNKDKLRTSHVLPQVHHLHKAFHQDPVESKEHIIVYTVKQC